MSCCIGGGIKCKKRNKKSHEDSNLRPPEWKSYYLSISPFRPLDIVYQIIYISSKHYLLYMCMCTFSLWKLCFIDKSVLQHMNNLSINLQIFSKDELIQRNRFIETTIVSELSPVAIGVKVIQVLTVSLHEFTYPCSSTNLQFNHLDWRMLHCQYDVQLNLNI